MGDTHFPRAAAYERRWAEEHSLGENVLDFAEAIAEVLPLAPGMRVLDLGCGHAISSIFLAREFGVQVWALDRAIDPTDNYRRAIEMGCESTVIPLRTDAREIPLPFAYFDAVVSFDAFAYFGTDERYLSYLARHIKPGGYLGVVDAYASREIKTADDIAPELREAWRDGDWYMVHTIDWWRRHWEKTGLVEVLCAERVPGSDEICQRYLTRVAADPGEAAYRAMVLAEGGTLYGTFRIVARRTARLAHFEDEDGAVPY